MKIDQLLNFRKGRSPVKINHFLKEEVTHEIKPVFEKEDFS
jgi:hypothetical protein